MYLAASSIVTIKFGPPIINIGTVRSVGGADICACMHVSIQWRCYIELLGWKDLLKLRDGKVHYKHLVIKEEEEAMKLSGRPLSY